MLLKQGLDDLSLHSDATAMDDAHFVKAFLHCLI